MCNMKHAYLITANSNFQVLDTCLKMLDNPANDIYILFDSKARQSVELYKQKMVKPRCATLKDVDYQLVNWGGYSQVHATLTLLEKAIESGERYAYLHFLQNSDLPVKSNEDILEFFAEHQGKEFVNIKKDSSAWAEKCCRYRYFFCHNRYYRTNKLLKGLNLFCAKLQQCLGVKHNTDISIYYGSALFSITLPFAKYLVENKKEIRRRFRWALAPDEKFVQTMLMNSPFADNLAGKDEESTPNGMLIDWTRDRKKNSPHVWRNDELDYLLTRPNGFCYARKFMEDVDMDVVRGIEKHFCKE